jgi:hypothetical protein
MLGAPILSYVQKKMQHFYKKSCIVVVLMLQICRRNFDCNANIIAIFIVRTAIQKQKNRAMKQCNDEFSTVRMLDQGSKRSSAINCATDSRARIKCISVPLTMTSAARGRVL